MKIGRAFYSRTAAASSSLIRSLGSTPNVKVLAFLEDAQNFFTGRLSLVQWGRDGAAHGLEGKPAAHLCVRTRARVQYRCRLVLEILTLSFAAIAPALSWCCCFAATILLLYYVSQLMSNQFEISY